MRPSGTGKTTLIQRLRAEFPNFAYSISCTTRAPRSHEVDGKDYHSFPSKNSSAAGKPDFLRNGPMCTAIITGRRLAPVLETLKAGQDVLFDIDVQARPNCTFRSRAGNTSFSCRRP